MAHFRYSAAIISRSAGQSVVAAAAYRAGEKLLDERTGDIKDYSRRGGVLNTLILTPDNASQWMLDRQRLWNEVEHREDQSNRRNQAQLARSLELSLPHELTHEQHIELLRDYFKTEYVALGMIADIAIHAPPERGDGTNHHAHVLLTMRNIIEDDGFGAKNRDWNQKALIERWRERWAEYQNRALEKYGFEARVDHRSLEDQGIDREPTTHLGPNAQALEDQGISTERGDENRRRKAANSNREQLKAELANINRRIAAVERIQRIVAAVEKGYERFEQRTRPEPESPEPQSPEVETRRPQSYAPGPEAAPMPDSGSPADKILADAQAKEQERQDQARKQEEDRQEAARKEQDRLKEASIAEDKRLNDLGQQHRDKLVAQAEAMRQEQDRLKAFRDAQERLNLWRDSIAKAAFEARRAEEQRRKEEQEKAPEGYIRDAGNRYAQSLREYDLLNPYQSLAKAAMAEHAAFRTEQETLSRQIAGAADPKQREALELRKKIEGYEYLSITGDRIAVQSEIITGRVNSQEAVRIRELVHGKKILDENGKQIGFEDGYKQKAQQLREQYRDLQAGRTVPAKEQERPLSAADQMLADAQRRTPAPSRSGQAGPNQYKDLGQKTQEETPEEKQRRLKQQELERKAQKDRDRER